jgi:hypothetical protein
MTLIKPIKWLRQVDAWQSDNVSGPTFPCHFSFCENFESSWDVADWHLVAGLLNFDLLEWHETRWLDLNLQISLHVVLFAFVTWTLNDWIELFRDYNLVNFVAAQVAGRDRHLDARLYITSSSHNSANGHKRPDLLCTYFAQFCNLLLALVAWHDHNLVVAGKLRRYIVFG